MINFYNLCGSHSTDQTIYFNDLTNDFRGIVEGTYDDHDNKLIVIRDDVYQFGTKARFAIEVIKQIVKEQNPKVLVLLCDLFDSTQIAVSKACKELNIKLKIYTQTTSRINNAYSEVAKTYGAKYEYFNSLKEAEIGLENYMSEGKESFRVPDGLNHEIYLRGVEEMCDKIYDCFGKFDEVWCTVESGATLNGIMRSKIANTYYAVAVKKNLPLTGESKLIYSEVDYEKSCLPYFPPYPSNLFVDSKIYKHVKDRKGKILIWNKV